MNSHITQQIYLRNYGVIDASEQQRLFGAKVTVVGAGGVGGGTLISLARMGVGKIKVVDMDSFDYSNINRQMLSGIARVDKNKAECAKETINDINPEIIVEVVTDRLDEGNAVDLLSGSDVIVDATDNLVSRVIIHRTAQKLQIPSVWIAVTPPFRGGVMTFSHETPDYELVLQHSSHGKELTEEVKMQINQIKDDRARFSVTKGALADWADGFINKKSPWAVICPVANMVGLLASFEVFKIIIKRPNLLPIYAPKLIEIDLARPNMVEVSSPDGGSWNNAHL